MTSTAPGFDVVTITQPHERLLTYYFIVALLTLPAFPVTMIVLYIKYRTMRFRFEEVNHGGTGWKDRLWLLTRDSAGEVEVCYEKRSR